jgi:diketogulonate reductase-like aldo/keto reductase
VELHPYLYQRELLDFCRKNHIVIEAYSPLTHGERLADPKLVAIAKKNSNERVAAETASSVFVNKPSRSSGAKSTAQILIRWALQHDVVVIPKSANRQRIVENADVFNFMISAEDMRTLDGFDENLRTCWDPTGAP